MYAILNRNNICTMMTRRSEGYRNPIPVNENVLGKKYADGDWVEVSEPEPTQLDRIEAEIMKSNDELRQEGADALTLELIEGGIL